MSYIARKRLEVVTLCPYGVPPANPGVLVAVLLQTMKTQTQSAFWTVDTFDEQTDIPRFAVDAYKEVLPYVADFLCAPHPHRAGPVCPFVPPALKHHRIFFTACSDGDTAQSNAAHIEQCIEFYLRQKVSTRSLGAIVILFPKEYNIGTLLELHRENKEQCVRHSLMLGALYPTSQAPSVHSEHFFPLRTPTPTLVIRDMVVSDLLFLDPKHYHLEKRVVFLESFIQTFHEYRNPLFQTEVQKAHTLLQCYQRRTYQRRMLVGAIVAVTVMAVLFWLW